jgi:hypothetical protein
MIVPPSEEKESTEVYRRLVMENSIAYTNTAVKELIAHSLETKVDALFDDISSITSMLIEQKSNTIGLTLVLVPKHYVSRVFENETDPRVKDGILYLLNMARYEYRNIIAEMRLHNISIPFGDFLQVDPQTCNLYIDENSEKRLCILYVKIAN